mgnify:CR=1 FL=1
MNATAPSRTARAAAEYFGGLASSYDDHYERDTADGHALRARLTATLFLVGDGPGELLDAGMGPGRLVAQAAEQGWTVSGVDASAAMVELARARLPEASDRLRVAPIEALPFPDGSFDAVTATGVLEYSDLPAALDELARVLRPGARAIVSYPNPRALYGIWKTRVWYPAMRSVKRALRRENPEMPRGAGERPPEHFTALLAAAGLLPVSSVYTSYLPVPTPLERLAPRAAARLAERLESRAPRGGRLLATQIVYVARRAAHPGAGATA